MLLYAIGSLLCGLGLVFAVGVIAANLAHYRQQMLTALRTLSLDSVHAQHRDTHAAVRPDFRKTSVRPTLRPAA